MRLPLLLLCLLLTLPGLAQHIVTEDVPRYYAAVEAIQSVQDSTEQLRLLDSLFLSPATPGQRAIMEARQYTAQEYLDNILAYPRFWASLRPNTLRIDSLATAIRTGVDQLKKRYPELRPTDIYFTVGGFRSPGTVMDGMALIGSEMAMADDRTDVSEFTGRHERLLPYYASNPVRELVFLNLHEYVHTQQVPTLGDILLVQTIYEGIAEFLATLALERASPTPAIAYGPLHTDSVRQAFIQDMFGLNYSNWLWNNSREDIAMADLGYYVGYAMAEGYYRAANDKAAAIRDLLAIDFSDQAAVLDFIDRTDYFSEPVATYDRRPTVTRMEPFAPGDQLEGPGKQTVTLYFSEPMDTSRRGFDYGPLGEDYVLSVKEVIGFAKDGKSFTFTVAPEKAGRYQVMPSQQFQSSAGLSLRPYLIDLTVR